MPITDILMSTGSFEFALRPDTPAEVRNGLDKLDTIVFTPSPVAGTRSGAPQTDLAGYLDMSMFTGRVTGRKRTPPGGQDRYRGQSIVSWFGDHAGRGYSLSYAGTATLGVRLIAMFAVPERTNGMTLGATTGISSNNINDDSTGEESPRTAVDRWCQMTTTRTEWRLQPNGTLDFTPYGTYDIFPGDYGISGGADIIIGRGLSEEWRSDAIVIPADSMEIEEDYTEFLTIIHVTDGTYPNFANTRQGNYYSYDGATLGTMEVWEQISVNSGSANTDAYADALERDTYNVRYKYKLEVDFPLADVLSPGARFLLYDPETEQTGNVGVIVANGKQIQPAGVRCTGLTYGVRGLGVYGFTTSDASNNFVNFTPWIDEDAEPRTTTIDVGLRPVAIGRRMRRGIG